MGKTLFFNIESLVQVEAGDCLRKPGREMKNVAELPQAFLVIENGKIKTMGPMENAPTLKGFSERVDCSGRLILPGFVDSHTHLLHVGERSDEFEMRCAGKSYLEIAQAGGGIKKSASQIKKASPKEMIEETLPRLKEMLSHGTTTVEIKSGYGLSVDAEIKMLRAIRALREKTPMEIHATFLGAHDIPPDVLREKYLKQITDEMIPQVVSEELAEFCDVFCDRGFFTPEETERIALAAKKRGLGIKIHANELGVSGGVEVAAKVGALSADHLLCLEGPQFRVLRESSVMATVLPGSSLFLKLNYAPVRQMMDEGISVALATDSNPGSCTATSMPLIMNIATTQMKMLPAEALTAATLHGAAALGISKRVGSLEVEKDADLIVTHPMKHYREIAYRLGKNPCWRVYKHGELVAEN